MTTGAAGGLFSGLTGVGGGAVMVPLLSTLLRMPQHRAHGTSLAIIIFVATAALIPYIILGEIDWGLAGALTIGSVFAAMASARLTVAIRERDLRRLFAVFLLIVAVRMLVG